MLVLFTSHWIVLGWKQTFRKDLHLVYSLLSAAPNLATQNSMEKCSVWVRLEPEHSKEVRILMSTSMNSHSQSHSHTLTLTPQNDWDIPFFIRFPLWRARFRHPSFFVVKTFEICIQGVKNFDCFFKEYSSRHGIRGCLPLGGGGVRKKFSWQPKYSARFRLATD